MTAWEGMVFLASTAGLGVPEDAVYWKNQIKRQYSYLKDNTLKQENS